MNMNTILAALDRMQQRFRRSRPGSVLILVVALLVLMALIGTAYISTARIDRYTTQQNAYNTQIDLLVQGVVNMAEGKIMDDAINSAAIQPPTVANPLQPIYANY